MLKVCSPLVVPITSWSSQVPTHEISSLLFSPSFSEIVTGGSGGELIIWTLEDGECFWPKWQCHGHIGAVKNLGFASCGNVLGESFFFSHSSNNEIAIWNWGDGTCVDIRIDLQYQHSRIKSYQPSFTKSRLLFCCGQYPCIVVMHAMQLSILFTLASNAQSNWIKDFSLFTHANLQQEVVLGITPSGFVTVWTITGKEALHSTIHEHESRRVKTSSPVLEIHCCQQLPRLVLLVCVSEWRILDAFDCSTQILQSSESSDVRFIGGAFFHKEFVAVYTSVAEARIYRLPRDLFSKMGDRIENTGRKPQLVAILKTKGKLDRELARHFRHLAVNKSRRPALGRLGAPSDAVTAFLAGTSDGSLQVWTLTTEQLVTSSDQQPLDLKPFLQTSLSDVWSKLLKAPSPTTSFFDIASSFAVLPDPPAEKLTITCCIVIYSTSAPLHSSKVPPASPPSHPCPPPLPPRVVLATASGDIIVAQLAPLLHSLWLPDQSPCRSEQYRLRGHRGPVLALLHPYSFARDKSAFRASLLVSGGEDCSVRAWDLDPHPTESRLEAHCLAVFHNHAAPVIALTVGPTPDSACGVKSTFLSSCVACVAADGTVSVISPQDRFTLLRARSGFGGSPVGGGGYGVPLGIHAISWRVVEMLLLILADDGSLSIWDLGLGQLERYETGAVALDIFNTGTDTVVISSRPSPLSLATITPANQSASAASTRHRVVPSRLTRRNRHTDQSRFLPPLVLQALGSNVGGGPAAIVFHYDIEAIITNLLSTAVSSKDTSSHSSHDIPLGLQDCANLLKILLSLIFPWGVSSAQSDEEIADGLQLTPPTSTRPDVLLGAISRSGYLSIKMPVPPSSRATTSIYTLSSRVSTRLCLSQVAIAEALCYAPVSRLAGTFKSSSAATMAISVCSSPAIIPRLSLHLLLAHWQAKCLHVRYAARTIAYFLLDALPANEWRDLVSQWTQYLPISPSQSGACQLKVNGTTNGPELIETPQQNSSKAESANSSKMPPALECCEHPSLLRISANLASGVFDTFAFGPKRILSGAAMHHYRVVTCAILALAAMGTRSSLDHLRPEVAARDLCPDLVSSDPPETDNPDVCRSQRGLASPHYGTYTTDTNLAPPPAKLAENHLNFEDEEVVRRTATSLVAIIDLTLSEQMNTAEASFAASHPLTVPYAASPVRRAAIDLLGRGFTLWEPYLDTAQLLTSLLSLIAEGSPNQFSELHPEEVLSDDADLARSARQALWQLTYTRPHLVVLNLSLMLRRLGANAVSAMVSAAAAAAAAAPSATSTTNASSSSTSRTLRVVMSSPTLAAPIFSVTHSGLPHATPPTGSSSPVPNAPHPRAIRKNSTSHAANPPQQTNHGLLPLLGARTEVLRLYADICQRRPNNLLPILPEFVEVILACVDRTQLKERGLNTAFPLLQRFNSVDSHTRAQKVCVGGTNGMLIFFDFKAGRYCSTRGHQTPVTAICFSSDGRQLASYAIDENTLRTWQLSTAGLFGMGGQQVRPLSSYPVRPLQPPSSQRLDPTMVSLTWPEPANIEIHHKGAFLRSVPLST